ncbi:MAG: hypothetical protein ABSG19_02515 [Candidatus Aminicenantales bacterium]
MDKHPVEKGIEDVVKTYELLDRIRLGRDLVIRDDQFEPEALLDAARFARSKGIRLSLLDTGRFEPSGLEWFIRERVRFYTSDEARPREPELARLLKACLSARTFLAYFQNGPLQMQPGADSVSLEALRGLTSAGMDIHISNRAHARDSGNLAELAENAAAGRSYFVYYHLGPLTPELTGLAAAGAWIHFPDRSLNAEDAAGLAQEIARAARQAGSRAAVYVETGLPLPVLEGLFAAGAAVLFRTPPGDRESLLRPFEQKARKRELPARAFYLFTTFLP